MRPQMRVQKGVVFLVFILRMEALSKPILLGMGGNTRKGVNTSRDGIPDGVEWNRYTSAYPPYGRLTINGTTILGIS